MQLNEGEQIGAWNECMSPVTVVLRRHYGLQPRDITLDISSLPPSPLLPFSVPCLFDGTFKSGCDRKRTDGPFSTERTVRSLSITTTLILLSQLPQ